MCTNKDCFGAYLSYYLRDRWAPHAPLRLSGGKMRAGHVAQLGGAVCYPAPGPSHVGGPSMWPNENIEGHICLLAPVPQSVIPEPYATIRIVPGNPSQSRQSVSIGLLRRQSDSIQVDSSLLHII